MKNIPLLVGTLVGSVVLVVVLAFFFSTPTAPKVVDSQVLVGQTKNAKGPEDAKVTVVEFSDLQCPACKATQPLVQQLLSKHGNQIRFVYRHFPLSEIHKNALQAAWAAEAAAASGKFWEFHDMMFSTQEEWADLSADRAKEKFVEYAVKLEIDKNEFEKRIDSSEARQRVTDDTSDGTKANVDATPTFFVNGQKTAAPQLLSTVESMLSSTK
jgi:formate-nitrite transporter family protein